MTLILGPLRHDGCGGASIHVNISWNMVPGYKPFRTCLICIYVYIYMYVSTCICTYKDIGFIYLYILYMHMFMHIQLLIRCMHIHACVQTLSNCWVGLDWYCMVYLPTCESFFQDLSMGYPTVHQHYGPKWPNWSVKCGFQLVICPVLMFKIQLGQDCRGLVCSFLSNISGVPYCYYYYYYPWTGNPVPKQPVLVE